MKCAELIPNRFYFVKNWKSKAELVWFDGLSVPYVPIKIEWTPVALYIGERSKSEFAFLVGDKIGIWLCPIIHDLTLIPIKEESPNGT